MTIHTLPYRAKILLWPARLIPALLLSAALASALAGCGGSSGAAGPGNTTSGTGTNTGGTTSAANPLTNPDLILFASARTPDSSTRFYAMNPDGSRVTPVASLSKFNARLSEGASLNQSGTFAVLAFDFNTGGGILRQLVKLSDGSTLLQIITSSLSPQTVFAANSTGTKVAVGGSPTSTDAYGIYLMNPDGTQKTQVYALPAGNAISEITLAPDDQTIYFVAFPTTNISFAGNGTLFKLAPGATAPIALANVDAPIYSLHTSRDGTKLAFVSVVEAADNQSGIFTPYTLNADGTNLVKGSATPLGGFVAPWNVVIASRTDGFHVLYVSSADGAQEIYDMRPDGTGLTQISFNASGSNNPGSRQAILQSVQTLGGR
jgi:Tol biopolymer transport system component